MVFPQGNFSKAAMSALKRTDLIASVNNDIHHADPSPRAITVSDVWDIAVYGLHLSALYPEVPVGGDRKLCVDALLGKPAIASDPSRLLQRSLRAPGQLYPAAKCSAMCADLA